MWEVINTTKWYTAIKRNKINESLSLGVFF